VDAADSSEFDLVVDAGSGAASVDGIGATNDAIQDLSITGATIGLGGDVSTAATQTYTGAATLDGNVALTGTDITFTSTLDGTTADTETLGVTASGAVSFNEAVGATPLGDVTINSAGALNIGSTLDAASFIQTTGTGTTTIGGLLTATTGNVSIMADSIALDAGIDTATAGSGGTVTLNATNNNSSDLGLVLTADGDISSDGRVELSGTTGIFTAGDVTTTDDEIFFTSNTELDGNVLLDSGSGATNGRIVFAGLLDGSSDFGETLELSAGTGNVFLQATGSDTPVGTLTIASAGLVNLNGNLRAAGLVADNDGGGATINSFQANGNTIDVSGATGSAGGDIAIATTGNIDADALVADGGAEDGAGGFAGGNIALDAGGDLTVGFVDASGSAANATGGAGGTIDLAGATLTHGTLTAEGGASTVATGGAGGTLALTADTGTLDFAGGSVLGGAGDTAGVNGDISLTAVAADISQSDGITASEVVLDAATDVTLNGGNDFDRLTFDAGGAVSVTEADGFVLDGTSAADSLALVATVGSITDSAASDLTVTGNASFTANGAGGAITLDDAVALGTLTFNSAGAVSITEADGFDLAGVSTAEGLSLTATTGAIGDTGMADLDVTGNARFTANGAGGAITLEEAYAFGSLTFASGGAVDIKESDATQLTGTSTAASLDLDSTGFIADDGSSDLTVAGLATLSGSSITLTDTNDFGSLDVTTTAGSATINETNGFTLESASIDASSVLQLVVDSGTVDQGAGAVTARLLAFRGGADFDLTGAGNDIDTFLADQGALPSIAYADMDGFTVQEITAGDITLQSAAGTIDQSGAIDGTTLTLLGTTSTAISLAEPTNDIGTLTADGTTLGSLEYRDADDFDVTGVSTNGTLTLRGTDIGLTGASPSITTNGGNILLDGAVSLPGSGTITLDASGGQVTFTGAITGAGDDDALDIDGSVVDLQGDLSALASLDLDANLATVRSVSTTGDLDILGNGAIAIEGAGSTLEATGGGNILLTGTVDLLGSGQTTLDTSAGDGDITLDPGGSVIRGVDGDDTLTATAGAGAVDLRGLVVAMNGVSVTAGQFDGSGIDVTGPISIDTGGAGSGGSIDLNGTGGATGLYISGGGAITLDGDVDLDGSGTTRLDTGGGSLSIDGNVAGNGSNDDLVIIAGANTVSVGGDLTSLQSLDVRSASTTDVNDIDTSGDLTITSTNIDLNGAGTQLISTGGNITLDGSVDLDGSGTLTLNAAGGDGAIQVTGVVTGTDGDDDLAVSPGAGTSEFLSAVTGLQSFTISSGSQADVASIDTSTGNLSITATNIDVNGTGTTLQTTAGGNLTLDGAVDLDGSGTTTLSTDGTTDGNILVTGDLTGTGGDDALVATAGSGTLEFQGDLINLLSLNIMAASQVDVQDVTTSGALAITADNIDLNGAGSTLQTTAGGALTLTGDVDLAEAGTHTLSTDGTTDGALTITGTVVGAPGIDLVVDGGTDGAVEIGAFNTLDAFTVSDADTLTVDGDSDAGTVNLNSTNTGVFAFDGALETETLTTTGTFDLALNGGGFTNQAFNPGHTGSVDFNGFTLNDGGNLAGVTSEVSGDVTILGDTTFGVVDLVTDATIDIGTNTVTFADTIDESADGGATSGLSFSIAGGGVLNFDDTIGFTRAIDSIRVNDGGTTAGTLNLNGGSIAVSGNTMVFNSAVVLGTDMTITDAGGADPAIDFQSTVDSDGTPRALAVEATNGGTIRFGDTVGDGSPLRDLIIADSSGVVFDAGATVDLTDTFRVLDTTGTITLGDVLTANAVDVQNGGNDYSVVFASAPDIATTGSFANTNVAGAAVEFDAGGTFDGGLTVSGGSTTLAGTLTTVTTGAIDLQDLTLDGDADLVADTGQIDVGAIDDDGAGGTTSAFSITSNGLVNLNGVIGGAGATAIDSLTVSDAGDGTGTLTIDAGAIDAAGGTLTFNTPVTLASDTTLVDAGATGVRFNSTVDGGFLLSVEADATAGGTIEFNDLVGDTTPLAALTVVDSAGTAFTDTVDVTTGAGLVTLTDTTGTITFNDVLTATQATSAANAFVVDFVAAPVFGTGGASFANTAATGGTQDLILQAGASSIGAFTTASGTETQLTGMLTTQPGNANLTLGDTLTLAADSALISGNGTIDTQAITDDGGMFDLALQNLTSTGPVLVNGAITVDSLTTFGAGYAVSLRDGGTITQDVNFLNTGSVTLGDDGADVLTFEGGLATAGNATNPSATSISGTVRTTLQQIDLGTMSLGANAVIDSSFTDPLAGEDVNIAGISNGGGFTLDLDVGSTGAINVAGTSLNLGALEIVDSAGAVFVGNLGATSIDITNSTGLIDFRNVVTATGSITAAADAYAVEFDATPSVDGAGSFANTGGVTFANGGTFDLGLTNNGGNTSVAGTLTTSDNAISLTTVTLDGSTTLDSNGGAIDTDAITGGGNALVLDGGATGIVGIASFDGGGDLTLTDSGGTTFTGAVTAGEVTLTDTTGTIAFQGDTNVQTLSTASQPYAVSFTGADNSVQDDTTFASTGTVTLGDQDTDSITFAGGLDTRTANGTSTAGSVETSGNRMDLSALTLAADTTLLAGAGSINGTSATDAGNSFTLSLQDAAATGAVRFTDAVTLNALQTFGGAYDVELLGGGTIDTDTTFANTTLVALGDAGGDSITFTGGLDTTAATSTRIAGTVAADGTQMDLGDTTLDASATLVAGAGAINVASATDGPNNFALSLQDGAATGAVTIAGDLSLTELFTFASGYDLNLLGGGALAADTNLLNTGALVIDASGADFDFNGGLDTTGGPSSLSLAGTIRTSNQAMDLGDATLTAATTLSSGAGAITTGAVSDGGGNHALTLQENTTASTGTVAITGNLAVEELFTFGRGYAVELTGATTTVDQAVDFLNTGTVRLGDGGDLLTFSGGLTTAGNATNPSSTIVDGDVVVGAGAALTLGSLTLGGNSSLDADGTGDLGTGAITGAGFDLSLDGDTGAVLVDSFSNLGALTLVDASGATFANASSATSVDLNGTQNATYNFAGPLTATTLTTNAANNAGVDDQFTLDLVGGSTITNAVTFDNAGDLAIGADGVTSTFNGGFTTSGVGGTVTLSGNVVASGGMTLGDLTLTADTTLDSNGSALTAGIITSNNVFALTLDGGAGGNVDVGSLVDGGDLTITDSASTTFGGAVNADTLTLTDTTGTIAFEGDTTIDTALVSQVNPYSVAFTGTTNSIAGATTFNHSGSLTLGDGGDDFTFDGGITATAPTVINLNGAVSVNGGVITLGDGDTTVNVETDTTLGGAATAINVGLANLADDTTLTLGTGNAADVTLAGALGTADAGATSESVVFDTTGTVMVPGAIGANDGSNDLDQLTVTQSGGTTFQSTLDAQSVTLTDTMGTIAFQGDTNIGTGLTASAGAGGYSVALTGSSNTIAGATSFLNAGSVTIGNALADVTEFTGGLDTTGGPSGTSVAGTVRADGQAIDLGATTLTANTTLDAGAGTLDLVSVSDNGNGFGLTLQDAAATGAVTIGMFTLGSLTTRAGAYDVSLEDSGTVTGDTNFLNTGTVILGNAAGDVQTFAGGLATAGNATNPGATNIAGTISTSDTRLDLGATTVTDTATLRSGAATLNLASVSAPGQTLNLQDGGGTGHVTIAAGSTIGTLGTGASAYDLSFNGGSGGSTTTLESGTTFANTGTVTFGNEAADAMIVAGSLDTAGSTAATRLGGQLTTEAVDGAIDLSDATLVAGASLESGAGALNLTSVTDAAGAFDLTLQNATSTGTVTATGAITVDSLTTVGSPYAVRLLGGATIGQDTNFLNTGALVIGDGAGDLFTFDGGLATTGNGSNPATVNLAGTVATSGDALDLAAVTLDAATTLTTAGGSLNAGPITAGGFDLTLAAGTGSTAIGDTATAVDGAGLLTVSSSTDTTFDGSVTASSIALNGTTGTITFTGDATATNGLTTSTLLNDLVFEEDLTVSGALARFTNSGNLRLGLGNDGDLFTFNAGLDGTGVGGETFLNGQILTGGQDLELADLTLEQATTLDSGGGALTFADVTGGGFALTLDADSGTLTGSSINDVTQLELRDADSATISGPVSVTTSVALNGTQAGTYTFGGPVTAPALTTSAGDFSLVLNGGATIDTAVTFDQTGTLLLNGLDTAQTYDGGLNTTVVGGLVTLAGDILTSADAIVLGDTALTAATRLDTGGGADITTGGLSSGGNTLTLDANTTGTIELGSLVGNGDLTLVDSADTTILGTLVADDVDLQQTQGTVSFQGADTTLEGALASSGGLALELFSTTTDIRVASDLNNSGGVTFGDGTGDETRFRGGIDTLDTGTTNLIGTLITNGSRADLSAVTLDGDATIDTAGGVLEAASGIVSGGSALTLDGGATGVLTVSGLSGNGALTVVDSQSTRFTGPVTASDVTLTDTSGLISFRGDTIFSGSLVTASNGYGLAFTGSSNRIAGSTTLQNTGSLRLGSSAGDSIEFTGGLDAAGASSPSSTRLAGTLTTAGGVLELNAATLTTDVTLDTTLGGTAPNGGEITTGTLTGGGNALDLNAGTGGAIGVNAFAGVSELVLVDGASADFAAASDATTVDLNLTTGGTIAFEGVLAATTLTTNQADDGNDAFSLALNGGASITNPVTFDQTGFLTLGDDGDSSAFAGGLIATTPSAVNVNGIVSAAGTGVITLGDVDTGVSVGGASRIGGSSTGQISLGDVSLTDGAALTVGTGSATPLALTGVRGTGDGAAERLTLDTTALVTVAGAIDSTVDAGGENNLDELVIDQSGGVRFQGTVDAETVTITDTADGAAVDFAEDIEIGTGLTVQPGTGDYDLRLRGTTTTIAGTTTFRNGGVLDLGDAAGDSLTFDTGVVATEPTTINLNGAVAVNTGDITLGDGDTQLNVSSTTTLTSPDGTISVGVASLADDVTLTLGNGGSNLINIAGATGTDDDGATAEAVEVNTTGDVAVTGAIGTDTNTLDALTITQSGNTTFQSTVDAEAVTLADTAGIIRFDADLTATTLNTAAEGYAVELPGGVSVTDATTFLNTGGVTLGDEAGDVSRFAGGLDTTAAGTTGLAGTVRTTDAALTLGAVDLDAATTLVSGSGALTVGSIAGGNQALTLQEATSTGAVTVTGVLDNLGSLSTAAGAFDLELQSGGSVADATTLQNTGTSRLGNEATDAFDFNGGLVATAGTTRLFGSVDTSNTDASLGTTVLDGTTSIDTGAGDLTIGATTGNGNDWTLTADALTLGSLAAGGAVRLVDIVSSQVTNDFAAASLEIADVGSTAFGGDLSTTGALELQDLGSLDVTGDTAAGSLTSNAAGSTLNFGGATSVGGALALNDGSAASFAGALGAGSFTSGATGMSISLNGAVNVTGSTNLQNTGGLVLGDDGDVQTFTGGLTATGSDVSLSADVRADGAAVELADLTQTGASSLRTTGGGNGAGASITLGGVDGGGFALSLNGGTGGNIGVDSVADAGTTRFVSASAVQVSGDLQATTAVVGDVDSFRVGGALDLGALDTSGAGSASVTLTGGGNVDNDTTFASTGGVSLGDGDGDRFVFGGGLDTTAGGTTLNADVATDSGRIDVGALTVAGDSTLDATNDGDPGAEGAAVELAGAVTGSNGSESLNVRGGTGAVTATAGVSGIGSFFVRSGGDLTLGEVSTNGNSIRGIVSGEVALQGNLTDATGDISIITTAGTLQQADDTRILAQQGNVHLAAFNRIRVFDVRSEQGSILLSLLDPSTNPDTPRVIQRGRASGDFTTDLTAPNGVVAVISGGKSDFGTSDNGFRIEANQQFVNLNRGSSFIDQSNAAPLTVLPSAQASQFQQVFEQNTPPRLPELEIEAALLASLSAAITNPANTVESASQATTIESQALTQQSEEEESLSDLSEDVFIDITLVNAEQQPLCLPESLQGLDSVGCDGQEAVAMWMERLGLQLVAATRDDGEPVLARMPPPHPGAERFGTAGGGH
jgi:hypothetical protein